MLAFRVAAPIPIALALIGCATGFEQARLDPVARVSPGDAPYAQVREVSLATKIFRLASDESMQIGVTVDVLNTTKSTLTVDIARSRLEVTSSASSQTVTLTPVAAGLAALPARADLHAAALTTLALSPGQGGTFWIVFYPFVEPRSPRFTLSLAASSGDMRITLSEPARPRWTYQELWSATGLGSRFSDQFFGLAGDQLTLGLGVWHARRAFKLGLTIEGGFLYEKVANEFERAFVVATEASLCWRRPRNLLGIFGAARWAHDFPTHNATLGARSSVAGVIGIEVAAWRSLTALAIRAGYTHVFDDHAVARDGLLLSIGRF